MEESLSPFKLEGVEETGEELGRGSYAKVVAVQYKGLRCAAKKVYEVLRYQGGALLERFAGECSLLSGLRHPHIVQFLGVYSESGSDVPVLVMEYLPATLAAFLDNYGVFPDEIGYSVLQDVALGLTYLHEHTPQPIIHRDLSANNVLLTSGMTAKISDLGVARILNLTPAEMGRMTQTPGTQAYMPPEAMVTTPKYDKCIDIFSYGVLMLHVLCGKWPLPTREAVEPGRLGLKAISEIERRETYLAKVGRNHPLMNLIRQCLANNPDHRPNIQVILRQVSKVKGKFPTTFENKLEMWRRIERDLDQKLCLSDEVSQLVLQVQEQKEQKRRAEEFHSTVVNHLSLQVKELTVEVDELKSSIAKLKELETAKDNALELKLTAKEDEIVANREELTAKLEAKDAEMTAAMQAKELEVATALRAKDKEFSAKLQGKQQDLEVKQLESSMKDTIIESQQTVMTAKDNMIQGLMHQLSKTQELVSNSAPLVSSIWALPVGMYSQLIPGMEKKYVEHADALLINLNSAIHVYVIVIAQCQGFMAVNKLILRV